MHVKIHRLFEMLLDTTDAAPEAFLGFSLAQPPKLRDFLAELDPDLPLDWNNQSFQGLTRLRENVLARAGLTQCHVDDVLITAGAAEANHLALQQLVQPGDELIAETPGWPQPFVLGEAIGCTVHRVQRREQAGWQLDLAELQSLISPRTRLIFLSNPNNPTGRLLEERELRAICNMADKVGAYVLVDEVYAGLEWHGARRPSVAGLYARGITTGSVSKALGLQGLRTGWLICRDPHVIRECVILRENTSEIMNVLGEHIAEIALREGRYNATIAQAVADGAKNLALLDAFIAARPSLSWVRPQAGLIGLCRLNTPFDGDALAKRLIAPPHKTFIISGSAYGLPQHIRVGVGGGEAARLDVGLSRLATALGELQR